MADAAVKHVHESMGTDWDTDALIVDVWLGDCPQDLISHAAGEALGLLKVETLMNVAETAGDM
eukprot:COSAG01_NODE_909_length_12785_cov_4.201876_7_plen_63_part_00